MLRWTVPGVLLLVGMFQLVIQAAELAPASEQDRNLKCAFPIDRSRARPLASWKPHMQSYSERHYGEKTWHLDPSVIVMHYTVSQGFPWNLVKTQSFAGETPGLAVHYVVQGQKVWEVLPPFVRSRGAYGINHRAINIEMVAMNAQDLSRQKDTLNTSSELVKCLMKQYKIPKTKIYSHQQVSKMDPKLTPEVLDKVNALPYHKIDPGPQNMTYLFKRLPK